MPFDASYTPSTTYLDLGDGFADPVKPAGFPRLELRFRNQRWAARMGLGSLTDDEWCRHLGRLEPLPGGLPQPLAMRYHGHQFGVYNPHLGDGRGFLLAQLVDPQDGRLLDLGTKGSGRTPYSRDGDGRLTLKGGVREVLAAALLEALGVYTSKAFSLFETGEELWRSDEPSPTRSSVLVRLSHSHLRIGTFQRHAFHQDAERLRKLVDHSLEHYLGGLQGPSGPYPQAERPARFLAQVVERVARLGAQYIVAGFVHGVLNTDNITITGESFDYGPYRFLPTFDPGFTAAYFDRTGFYAFGRQPGMLRWNLVRLAEALALLAPAAELEEVLLAYEPQFEGALRDGLLLRLNLLPREESADQALLEATFRFLSESQVPFECLFFDWYGGALSEPRARAGADVYQGPAWDDLAKLIKTYQPRNPQALHHPYFTRPAPCTLLIEEVEALWAPIAEEDDWRPFHTKLQEIEEMRQALQGP